MPAGLSLYLDLVRFTAAALVLAGHFGFQRISGGLLWQVSALGTPCVVVFFVLSGFVIAYVTDRPNVSGAEYVVSRAARVLSVTLPAIALTFALDWIGMTLSPDLYAESDSMVAGWVPQLLAGAVFLNESWLGHIRLGSNGAYWSLGYEVWYYVAFGLWTFAPARWRILVTLASLAVAGPRVASMFPLWLLGVGCYRFCRSSDIRFTLGVALWAGTTAFAAAVLARYGTGPFGETMYFRPFSGLWLDYAIGVWFALHAVGAWFAAPVFSRVLGGVAPIIRSAAGVTFTLYLVHYPVLMFLRAISPFPASAWQNRVTLVVGVTLAVVLMAQITEYRRDRWRAAISRLLRAGPRPVQAPVVNAR